jgi:hypothetical protein
VLLEENADEQQLAYRVKVAASEREYQDIKMGQLGDGKGESIAHEFRDLDEPVEAQHRRA